ncbi:MAG: T9SS type A sorting domain-containing protein [Candidatus Stahlbacteria bacterium]|nr:T9SS type A sorting domain-containing protein [Candidatus Stahlbacteria bacterium]
MGKSVGRIVVICVTIFIAMSGINADKIKVGNLDYYKQNIMPINKFISKVSEFSVRPDSLPAFPGAQGYGIYSTIGGRLGQVIHVRNLNPSGPGSFASACATPGPRIVVFDTSGVIRDTSTTYYNIAITHPYITIAGQTAPGAGITVEGALLGSGINDVIIRFLRLRNTAGFSGDVFAINTDCSDVIVDHSSFSWTGDETIDITNCHDATVQWCTLEEAGTYHNFGLYSGYTTAGNASVHHNLFAHLSMRNPMVIKGPADIRNNVVYNMVYGYSGPADDNPGGPEPNPNYNIIGNYYKRGLNRIGESIMPFHDFQDPDTITYPLSGRFYLSDNFVDNLDTMMFIENPWHQLPYYSPSGNDITVSGLGTEARNKLSSPVATPFVTTYPVLAAYDTVLKYAGCFPRDTVTRRMINDTKNRTGVYGIQRSNLMAGLTVLPRLQDTDDDGMPDSWEDNNGLDKYTPDNNTIMVSGYTAIEEYINYIADSLITSGTYGVTTSDEKICDLNQQNIYPNPWNGNGYLRFKSIGPTTIKVFNVAGKKVYEKNMVSRDYHWDGRDNKGKKIGSGVYFYRLSNKKENERQGKIVVLR